MSYIGTDVNGNVVDCHLQVIGMDGKTSVFNGKKVILTNPESGYDVDKQQLQEFGLKKDGIYTIANTNVHRWITDIQISEVPGVWFNAIHFSDLDKYRELTGFEPKD